MQARIEEEDRAGLLFKFWCQEEEARKAIEEASHYERQLKEMAAEKERVASEAAEKEKKEAEERAAAEASEKK